MAIYLKRGASLALMLMTVVALVADQASGILHRVGGRLGWSPQANCTEWSSKERFYVGEWLIFMFDKHLYNVLEVNETNYNSCNDRDFVTNITRGGRDVFQLTEAKPYYFISGGGYCWHGMKLALHVEEAPPPRAPAPTPANGASTPLSADFMLAFSIVSVKLVSGVLFGL